jgi:hypothetical protein
VNAKTPQDDKPTDAAQEAAGRACRAREAYEKGILVRGEAAVADERGRLPPGATHEIIGHDENGRPILKRRRFSAF